eukprot:COSAG06_NODE_22_length_33148_cov_102.016279_7_plen_83_part_00
MAALSVSCLRFKSKVTMPGSRPTKLGGVTSKEACCTACFNTSWCVAAIYQPPPLSSCNMHGGGDVKPLTAGEDWGCSTGRAR